MDSGDRATHSLKKIRASLFLGIGLAVLGSAVRLYFFQDYESYSALELQAVGLYLLQYQLNTFLFWSLFAGVAFAVVWLFWEEFEGLAVAGFVVLVIFVPTGFYINREHLPGIREAESLIGNGILLAMAAATTFGLYFKLLRGKRFLARSYTHVGLFVALLLIAAVNFAYLSQPAHTRLSSTRANLDSDFLTFFEFPSHDGASVASHGFDRTELLQRFSQRTEQVRNEVQARIQELYPNPQVIIERADAVLQREFTLWDVTKQLPEKIDWYHNPTDDKVWIFALNEFEWLWDVVAAYILTGDEKYARDFEQVMRSFFEQVSMIRWKNEQDPVWRLIGTGLRLSDSWVDAFYVFLPSPNVSTEIKVKMLASIHDQAQWLYYFRSPRWNHLIQESYGLLKTATMFPEFKMADDWLEMAVYRLDHAITFDVYPDGGYTEASTFYHRYVVRLFEMIVDYAERHDVHLTDDTYAQLERMYEFLMYTARPDDRLPQVNDGFHAKILRKLFHAPAERFGRRDFAHFATDGQTGVPPAETSKAFPYTGLYVMRSDWSDDALYCLFDGGLFGSAHGHEDKLSFEMFAYGSPFIIEAGTYTYVYNRWHKYFESSFSHNTIVVDGKSQLRQPYKDEWATHPHAELPNTWISNAHFDYIESTYAKGYGNIKEEVTTDVTHTRRMLFVKPDYWILWDVLRGEGEHRFEQLFHFAPGEVTVHANKSVVANGESGARLLLAPLDTTALTVEKVTGATDPIRGWISPKYGVKQKAPTIIYSRKRAVPAEFVVVMTPFQQQEEPKARLTRLPVRVPGQSEPTTDALALEIATDAITDHVLLAPNVAGKKQFGDFVSHQQLSLKRFDSNNNVLLDVESNLQQ